MRGDPDDFLRNHRAMHDRAVRMRYTLIVLTWTVLIAMFVIAAVMLWH